MKDKVYIARVGKSVGLFGENRLILDSDFPEQFFEGASFESKRGTLIVDSYNENRGLVKFKGVTTREDAKKMTNLELFTTQEATKEACSLNEGEFFWFDIIDCSVFEDDRLLGVVTSVERLEPTDYLMIQTESSLVEKGNAKSFMIPYVDHFIAETKISEKRIDVKGGLDILEAS